MLSFHVDVLHMMTKKCTKNYSHAQSLLFSLNSFSDVAVTVPVVFFFNPHDIITIIVTIHSYFLNDNGTINLFFYRCWYFKLRQLS